MRVIVLSCGGRALNSVAVHPDLPDVHQINPQLLRS
jgi:hypothetical protein